MLPFCALTWAPSSAKVISAAACPGSRICASAHMPISLLAELVAEGEVRPAQLEAVARQAAQAVDPQINAVVETWPTDDEPAPGSTPLAGVPFLIKDIAVAMAGRRMELGSRLAAGNVVGADSSLMRRFRRAGLVTFGRTATPEMAYGISTESAL